MGASPHLASCSQAFLAEHGLDSETISRLVRIISLVGFKEELKAPSASGVAVTPAPALPLEAAIVQDSDR
jgi:hypothetical protein